MKRQSFVSSAILGLGLAFTPMLQARADNGETYLAITCIPKLNYVSVEGIVIEDQDELFNKKKLHS